MKIYVASGYENRVAASDLIQSLRGLGFTITLDWTQHEEAGATPQALDAIASADLEAVRQADGVVVLLPGGPGTHTEMGAALILRKRVVVVTPRLFQTEASGLPPCIFYRLAARLEVPTTKSAWTRAEEIAALLRGDEA